MECREKTIERDLHKTLFQHNRVCLICIAMISAASVAANLVLSWILQQVVDLATGAGNTLSLYELCVVSILLLTGCAVLTICSSKLKPKFISKHSDHITLVPNKPTDKRIAVITDKDTFGKYFGKY